MKIKLNKQEVEKIMSTLDIDEIESRLTYDDCSWIAYFDTEGELTLEKKEYEDDDNDN